MKHQSGRFRAIWTIIWKSILFIVLWGFLLAPFIIPIKQLLPQFEKNFPLQARLYFDAASALSVLATAWIMVRFIDRRPFVTLGFVPEHLIRDVLAGLCIGTVWLGVSVLALWIMGFVSLLSSFKISLSVLGWAAAALVFNTVTQEVLVRSYIYQTIQSQTNFIWAIAGSSILFMLLHAGALGGAWLPALNLFLAGVFFGVAYHRSGNLWLPIAIHFAWNLLLGPLLGLTVSGQNELNGGTQLLTLQGPAFWTGGSFGMEGGFAVTLSTVMGAAAALHLIRWSKAEASPAIVLGGESI
jgi:uncharacterized protein